MKKYGKSRFVMASKRLGQLSTVLNLLVISISGSSSLMAADLGTAQSTQWAPYVQWTLANPTWSGNAFDVSATVEFRHAPSGRKRRTQMFYIGDQSWSFRFTGTQLGTWSFVTSSKDQDLHGHTGQVTVVPNPNAKMHGFLKNFNGKWGWQATDDVFVPQLAMWDYITGSSSPQTFHNKPQLVDRKIEQFIVRHGFNGFHVSVIAGRWFDLDAETDVVKSSMTDPDPRTFEALELLITRTHQAGGMVHIWLWGDHSRSQTPKSLQGGLGGEIDQRLQRYIAARLGPIPGWSMGYGFDLDEWVSADQVRAWHNAMHQNLGWRHFLGGRPVGPNQGLDHISDAKWNKGLDYSSYEHHRPTYDVYLAALKAIPGQPVMSEDRFRVRKNRYPEKDYTEELTRRGLYDSTLAGGVGNIWGIHPDLSSGGVFPNAKHIKTYSTFFHGRKRFLADMTPANHLSNDADTRILQSRETSSLVLYCESTSSIHIDLSDMPSPQPGIAVDAKKAYSEIHLGNLSAKAQTIELPTASDWVIAIGHFGQSAGAAELSFTDIWKGPKLMGGHGAMWADVDGERVSHIPHL